MKQAAGEANMTVITIVLIGVISEVGIILVPKLLSGRTKQACCTDAAGIWSNNKCNAASGVSYDKTAYESCIKK